MKTRKEAEPFATSAWRRCLMLSLFFAPPLATSAEDVRLFSLLDNGDFAEEPPTFVDGSGVRRIPWWRSSHGAELLRELPDGGGTFLRTGAGQWAEQPFAAYAPLIDGLVLRGRVLGAAAAVQLS